MKKYSSSQWGPSNEERLEELLGLLEEEAKTIRWRLGEGFPIEALLEDYFGWVVLFHDLARATNGPLKAIYASAGGPEWQQVLTETEDFNNIAEMLSRWRRLMGSEGQA